MSIDLAQAIRRRKPDKQIRRLTSRPLETLVAWSQIALAGSPTLLLDTTVYIHSAAGRLEAGLQDVIDRSLLFHCSVALAELATGVANADPGRPAWEDKRDYYTQLFATVPSSRLLTPDAQGWIEAGLIAGTLARTQGFQRHQRKECLNDVLILLTAAKAGLTVLTSNTSEFDLVQQVAPDVRFIHYQAKP